MVTRGANSEEEVRAVPFFYMVKFLFIINASLLLICSLISSLVYGLTSLYLLSSITATAEFRVTTLDYYVLYARWEKWF